MASVIVERQRIGDAAAGEDEPLLAGEPGDVLDPAEALRMSLAGQERRVEQGRCVLRRDRAVADPPFLRLDLDERLEPEEAARSRPDDLELDPRRAGFVLERRSGRIGADRERRRNLLAR